MPSKVTRALLVASMIIVAVCVYIYNTQGRRNQFPAGSIDNASVDAIISALRSQDTRTASSLITMRFDDKLDNAELLARADKKAVDKRFTAYYYKVGPHVSMKEGSVWMIVVVDADGSLAGINYDVVNR